MSRSVKSGAAVVCRSCQTLGRCKRSRASMREAPFRDSSNRLMFRRGTAAAHNAGLAASSVRAAQSGRARSFARHRSVLADLSNGSWQVHASDTQQHQSVVGASRRRAAPGSQSVELAALPGFGQLTSSSKRVGRVPWQSCPSSNIARALPSNYAGQSISGYEGLARLRASHQFRQRSWSRMLAIVYLIEHRPNPSIERTSNGGAHRFAPSRSVTPLAAAHVKR